MVWPHVDQDGSAWLCVSRDFTADGAIVRTLRVDFDGSGVRGGWSPAALNWDDGVRAEEAGVDVAPPDGILVETSDPDAAADLVAQWFDAHERNWHDA